MNKVLGLLKSAWNNVCAMFSGNSNPSSFASKVLPALAIIALVGVVGSAHAQTVTPLVTADAETGDLTINVAPYALKMLGYIVLVVTGGIALWYIWPIIRTIKRVVTGRG